MYTHELGQKSGSDTTTTPCGPSSSHIKFNFQSGLCDNLQNDVYLFLFSVSHFTLGCLVPSAEYTHMTHLLSF